MTNKTVYYKHSKKYLSLVGQFLNYLTLYKLDYLTNLPKEANLVVFDENDKELTSYSYYLLKKMMENKTPNIVEVRKTGEKKLPWEISMPINLSV
ncbi:MAG TPA: DUF5647 family protein [Candidatus Acidoferrales bacterium]|nr:DUF5647 family protein [Candidatus Acidoferrales bacterium]